MIRAFLAIAFAVAALSFSSISVAQDKKGKEKDGAATKKLEGKLCCTKCSLAETDKCGHALKVKDGDKEVKYYLDDKGAKEAYHKKVCTEEKDATVEGKVEEKDGKKMIKSPKVTVK
jgi:Family of unknown function (DUF6370)